MTPAKDITTCFDQMVIVEKYERVISYLYPIAQSMPRDDLESLQKFLAAWSGHVQWADSNNLFNWMENRYGVSCN